MRITKEEYIEWKHSIVTKELFNYISEQIDSSKETLVSEAGLNPLADQNSVGGIAAFKDILEWQPTIIEE